MRRNWIANIIAALNQDCVAHPFPYPVIVISDSFRLAALCALPAICRYGLNFPDAYQARNALMTLYRS